MNINLANRTGPVRLQQAVVRVQDHETGGNGPHNQVGRHRRPGRRSVAHRVFGQTVAVRRRRGRAQVSGRGSHQVRGDHAGGRAQRRVRHGLVAKRRRVPGAGQLDQGDRDHHR